MRVIYFAEDEDDGEEQEGKDNTDCVTVEKIQEEKVGEECPKYNTPELPLYSVAGLNQSQTMKLRARLGRQDIIAMVDSGASHNFISRELIVKLGMEVDEAVRFGVCLGDGGRVSG